jgi:hypothetical protein
MLCRKARQRLERHRKRREFRATFAAAVKHAQAQLARERTWHGVERIILELNAIINKETVS